MRHRKSNDQYGKFSINTNRCSDRISSIVYCKVLIVNLRFPYNYYFLMEFVPNLEVNNTQFFGSLPANPLNWTQSPFPIFNPLISPQTIEYQPASNGIILQKFHSFTSPKKQPNLGRKGIGRKEKKAVVIDAKNTAEFEIYRREKNRLVLECTFLY